MLINDIAGFPKNQRIMGLDLGRKTIGIAISDILQTVATPLVSLRNKKFSEDAAQIIALIKEYEVGGIVIGLPVNMDGSEGKSCQSARQFGRNLQKLHDIPVHFHDERLSTAAVQRMMKEAEMTTGRRSELVDKLAASYILQGFLDMRG